jgi:5'-nucleotidase
MQNHKPLILVTNDDGIKSPGLIAAVDSVLELGDVLVAAPCQQWSGASRCFHSDSSGAINSLVLETAAGPLEGYCVDGTPAQSVLHALLRLVPRTPDLVVVGINFGENLGADATVSGTVGAALQGATAGIPSLAVSLQTPKETHTQPSDDIDFSTAIHFTHYFAQQTLRNTFPHDVDALKIDIPDSATDQTDWRVTRVSRHTYFRAISPEPSDLSQPVRVDYKAESDYPDLEPDSDIYALAIDRVVSVAPMSIDLTSRANAQEVEDLLRDT